MSNPQPACTVGGAPAGVPKGFDGSYPTLVRPAERVLCAATRDPAVKHADRDFPPQKPKNRRRAFQFRLVTRAWGEVWGFWAAFILLRGDPVLKPPPATGGLPVGDRPHLRGLVALSGRRRRGRKLAHRPHGALGLPEAEPSASPPSPALRIRPPASPQACAPGDSKRKGKSSDLSEASSRRAMEELAAVGPPGSWRAECRGPPSGWRRGPHPTPPMTGVAPSIRLERAGRCWPRVPRIRYDTAKSSPA